MKFDFRRGDKKLKWSFLVPLGTETDFFAGYRACKCLEGFYRTHMFEKCFKCGHGLECQNDYASLKPGYWWDWQNESHIDRYKEFIKNLQLSRPALDNSSVQIPYPLPTPFKCPVEGSCMGGLNSQCKKGYEGPLCAVCSMSLVGMEALPRFCTP